jgi:hypothetical protein
VAVDWFFNRWHLVLVMGKRINFIISDDVDNFTETQTMPKL